jgi:hypothetical protein
VISSILQTRLQAVDAEYEATIRDEINELYKEIRYDGAKLRHPPFESV